MVKKLKPVNEKNRLYLPFRQLLFILGGKDQIIKAKYLFFFMIHASNIAVLSRILF